MAQGLLALMLQQSQAVLAAQEQHLRFPVLVLHTQVVAAVVVTLTVVLLFLAQPVDQVAEVMVAVIPPELREQPIPAAVVVEEVHQAAMLRADLAVQAS